MKRIALAALVTAALALPGPAAAQSLYSAAGLGLPTEAVDARSRALGNVGVGLLGTAVLPTDPAAAALLAIPGATFTAQPTWTELGTETGGTTVNRATRFPLMGVAYPAWGFGMATVTFGSVLDQRFEGTRSTTVELEDGPVTVTDEFVSQGGVSEVRLGLARPLGNGVQVGLSVGRYTGSTTRTLIRELEDISVEGTVSPFQEGGIWDYSGTTVTGGASLNIGTVARVAGSLTWSSDLTAEPSDTATALEERSFALPLQYRLGASALLAPGLMLTASVSQAGWGETASDLKTGRAEDVTQYGVGLELTRARLLGKQAPIRLGYRSADLPFGLEDGGASETAFTGGLGLVLSGTGPIVLAGVDLAVERGERVEGPFSEDFWRGALTLRVSGF